MMNRRPTMRRARQSSDPLALASALRKIESRSQQLPIHSGNPATAHLFIINPFGGMSASELLRLFSTHPSTEDRISRLETMARSGLRLAALGGKNDLSTMDIEVTQAPAVKRHNARVSRTRMKCQ